MKNHLIITLFALLLIGCAGNYNVIAPKSIAMNIGNSDDLLDFEYKYNILEEKGNKKYVKKETKKIFN